MRFSMIGTGIAEAGRSSRTWARFKGSRRFTASSWKVAPMESKNLLYPTFRTMDLAPRPVIRQSVGVRRVGLMLCVVASTAVASPRASNPAFLGIQMFDATGGRGPCTLEGAPRHGPPEAAG